MSAVVTDHGTYARYKHGCRCDDCREYQRARVARNRAERKETGYVSHGTRSSYDAGCRCLHCRVTRHKAYEKNERIVSRHNHLTRDIKAFGECPACDDYLAGVEEEVAT